MAYRLTPKQIAPRHATVTTPQLNRPATAIWTVFASATRTTPSTITARSTRTIACTRSPAAIAITAATAPSVDVIGATSATSPTR